ncbi:Mce protein [Mycobacterium sp. IDR2000157661]|uniref:Mce protein n=1 Tax=Mycobacterium sp. IDR2000157661 TaxID=2867005 RepID=UPI001EEA97CE|nr:Mce protein [Mycobacterium sp. IDR2000157661]ULE31417.1 Mce protein [Mycobacterium sp. IDR2000157661]
MADDAATPEGELSESPPEERGVAAEAARDEAASDEAADIAEAEAPDVSGAEAASDEDADEQEVAAAKPPMSHVRLATIVGLVLVVALAGLTGWLGFRAYQSHQTEELHKLLLQVGRQGALNLTTISHEQAEADVQRVLDSATGTFYDDFQQRAAPFVEVVKQAQSESQGTIAEAGLESVSGEEGKVLVAVTVQTSNAGAPEQQPRAWRMRLTVQKTGEDEAKVSNVEFVP